MCLRTCVPAVGESNTPFINDLRPAGTPRGMSPLDRLRAGHSLDRASGGSLSRGSISIGGGGGGGSVGGGRGNDSPLVPRSASALWSPVGVIVATAAAAPTPPPPSPHAARHVPAHHVPAAAPTPPAHAARSPSLSLVASPDTIVLERSSSASSGGGGSGGGGARHELHAARTLAQQALVEKAKKEAEDAAVAEASARARAWATEEAAQAVSARIRATMGGLSACSWAI